MTSSNSRRTVFALACAATLSLVAAPAPVVASPEDPQTNKEWDEYYRGPGIFREMPALYYTSDFTEVFNAIVPIGKGETCQSAVEGSVDGGPFAGMLAQLNKLRKESPELLEGMSYGPVHIDSEPPWLDAGHFGVVIYPTPGPGETWEDTIHRGVVIEQTNYISDVTGKYLLRNWDDWENPTVACSRRPTRSRTLPTTGTRTRPIRIPPRSATRRRSAATRVAEEVAAVRPKTR